MPNSAPLLPRLVRRLTVTVFAAFGSLSCSNQPAAVKSCDLCTSSAIVAGTVRDTLGAPMAGALALVTAHVDSCTGASAIASTENAPGPTDATGRFGYRLRSPLAPFAACVEVKGLPLTDTLVRADTVLVGKLVQFRADFPPGGPHDSVGIDLVLRHR
jgi:hypothetical protein